MTRQTVSRMVHALEGRGWIERERVRPNGKNRYVSLTRDGAELVLRILAQLSRVLTMSAECATVTRNATHAADLAETMRVMHHVRNGLGDRADLDAADLEAEIRIWMRNQWTGQVRSSS